MNIAILGGRFDPPHIGHWLIAQQVLEKRPDIDELWFMPANKHQWKPIVGSPKDRLSMLRFLKNDSRMKISDIELKRQGTSYTINTVREIKNKNNHNIYWVIGADIVVEFPRWKKTRELTKLATFLVFPRDPYALPLKLPNGFEQISGKDLVVTNLSSSLIRNRIKNQQTIAHLVPEKIEEYIRNHKLYK